MNNFPVVVRAFVFNAEGQILLVHHKPNTPWALPGGHLEPGEHIHAAMLRELKEEFGISAKFFNIDSEEILHHRGKKFHHLPLPISIFENEYITNSNGAKKSRTEYIFLMETDENIKNIQEDEIFDYAWCDPDTILVMKPNEEIWDFIIEMLEKIIGLDDDNL